MRSGAENQTGIQQDGKLGAAGGFYVRRCFPGGNDTEFSMLKSGEDFSQPLFVRHVIAVDVA